MIVSHAQNNPKTRTIGKRFLKFIGKKTAENGLLEENLCSARKSIHNCMSKSTTLAAFHKNNASENSLTSYLFLFLYCEPSEGPRV